MKGCCLVAMKGWCLAALYIACSCASGVSASGDDGPEAAAVYSVAAGTSSIVAVPSADFAETLAFMVVPASSADKAGLEGAEEASEAAWHGFADDGEEPTTVVPGEPIIPSATTVYQISLGDGAPFALVPVEVAEAGAVAMFVQHGPGEVETGLASSSGVALTAAASEGGEEGEEEEEEEDAFGPATGAVWINAIAGAFAVSAASLAGLVVVVNKRVAHSIDLSNAFTFASGALLAAAFLHIIPEAMEGLAGEGISLHDIGLDTGLNLLIGLFLSIAIRAMLETGGSEESTVGSAGGAAVEAGAPGDQAMVHACGNTQPRLSGADNLWDLINSRKGRSLLNIKGLHPVVWNVIIGDLVHNFADGFIIGGAFLGCGNTIGWTVTASTILHEIPHEIADFMALLNGGMSVKQAFAYNFMSALSAVLGVIIILAFSNSLSDAQISVIVLLGAGSFVFIGLSELLPGALSADDHDAEKSRSSVQRSQFIKLLCFTFGALLIGGPLVFDQHCEAGGAHDH